MTDQLVAFLRARLDEDEQIARAATTGPWRYNPDKHHHVIGTPHFEEAVFAGPAGKAATCVAAAGPSDDQQSMADATHIARHDPARVLAEVDAKRCILDRYERAWANRRAHPDDLASAGAGLALHGAVKSLALPYADHPDYRQEWRP